MVVIVLVLVLGVVGKENKIVRYSDNNDDDDKDGAEVAWMSGRVVDRLERNITSGRTPDNLISNFTQS